MSVFTKPSAQTGYDTRSFLSEGLNLLFTFTQTVCLAKAKEASLFGSHWAPHSFGLVPHRSKELRKLLKNQVCPLIYS